MPDTDTAGPPADTLTTTLMLLALGGSAGLLAFFPIENDDFWWDLTTGRLLVDHGTFLRTNWYSFTEPSSPWVNLHWLYQAALYLGYTTLGPASLVGAKAVVLAGAVLLAATAIPRALTPAGILIAGLALLAAEERFTMRVEFLSYFFIATYLFILERARTGEPRLLFVLPPLQILWANVHGVFAIGWAILGCYLLGELLDRARTPAPARDALVPYNRSRLKALLIITGVCAVAPFANPYGVDGWLFPWRLIEHFGRDSVYADAIAEFLPPAWVWFAPAHGFLWAFWLLGIGGAVLFATRGRRVSATHALIFLTFGALALAGRRNIAVFAVAILPGVLYPAARFSGTVTRRLLPRGPHLAVHRGAACVTGAIILAGAVSIATGQLWAEERSFRYIGAGIHPQASLERPLKYMRDNGISGPTFHGIREAGYFLWARAGDSAASVRAHLFIDGRLEAYSPAFFSRFVDLHYAPALWEETKRRYDIHSVFLRPDDPSNAPLIATVFADPDFIMVFADASGVVFVRPDHPAADVARTKGAVIPFLSLQQMTQADSARARLLAEHRAAVLADVFLTVNNPKLAARMATLALEHYPESANLHLSLASAAFALGDGETGFAELDAALRLAPGSVRGWYNRGVALVSLNRTVDARLAFERAHGLDPTHTGALYNLGTLAFTERRLADAERYYRRYVELAPRDLQGHVNLALTLTHQQKPGARAAWRRVADLARRYRETQTAAAAERYARE